MLDLYWRIGSDILAKQEEQGWGAKVINQLSKDLSTRFPEDKGYSVTNLKYMRGFASNYPDFPYVKIPLAKLRELPISQATLDQITWYHHISLIPKGKAITNFQNTLPTYQSDLAQYAFKDPYNFSFLGTVALQNERDIEVNLAKRITKWVEVSLTLAGNITLVWMEMTTIST